MSADSSDVDRDQIRAYLALKVGRLSNHELVSHAQDRLGEEKPPAWVEELAFLGPTEVPGAWHVLEHQLYLARVLPDSVALREEIRRGVIEWVERLEASGVVETDGEAPTVVRFLRLCPSYTFNHVSALIEEFPYNPDWLPSARSVQSPQGLAAYIREHLDSLVPARVTDSV